MAQSIELDAQQHAEAIDQLRSRFPQMSDSELEALLRGVRPPTGGRVEAASSPQQEADLQHCLTLANDLYTKALDAAKEITNPVGRAVARAVALGVYSLAAIECYDNNS